MSTASDILREELDVLLDKITARMEEQGKVVSGRTRDALEVNVSELHGQLIGPSYMGVLERGRKPGKGPSNFVEILKEWIIAKGLSFEDEEDLTRYANAIKWKIIREGSALFRSGQRDDVFSTPIEEFSDTMARRLAGLYQTEIDNQIFRK